MENWNVCTNVNCGFDVCYVDVKHVSWLRCVGDGVCVHVLVCVYGMCCC